MSRAEWIRESHDANLYIHTLAERCFETTIDGLLIEIQPLYKDNGKRYTEILLYKEGVVDAKLEVPQLDGEVSVVITRYVDEDEEAPSSILGIELPKVHPEAVQEGIVKVGVIGEQAQNLINKITQVVRDSFYLKPGK